MNELSKIELLVLIKNNNKNNDENIKNIDKLKKNEILQICQKYGIDINEPIVKTKIIDLRNIAKADLHRDIELFFLKQNKTIPKTVLQMRKKDLIDFMELNEIQHYTKELLESETKMYQDHTFLNNVIIYNIMRYDNIDISQIPDTQDSLKQFIIENKLDTNIYMMHHYSVLLFKLYDAYDEFCTNTGGEKIVDKPKSFPKFISNLTRFV
jgi:hypothetical protein